MKNLKLLLSIAAAAILFSGCMKEDIDELRRETAENAARIAALESWQATVNSNISALQGLVSALENNDYVTGVTTFDTPAPGGTRITFTKSGEVTIMNGAKGTDGTNGTDGRTPVIAVKKDVDGIFYWTVDDDWLTDDGTPSGHKIPVTGDKGEPGKTAYELAVENGYSGTLTEWLMSLNGTNGVNGKSAYQQAVDNGYNGTETEWLESLKGSNGADGTDGKSAYELAVEKGYMGTVDEWLASLNGTNGIDGKSAYEQAVDNGYNGSETEWLGSLQGATGIPGSNGQDGATPKVTIGQNGKWYISADGSAAGPAPGLGWTDTGIAATGDKGDKGDKGEQGDAIFAANGVDNSNPDYVVFTLANNGGIITVPKYKTVGISFNQPGLILNGTPTIINYTSTGTEEPTNIRVVDVPLDWKVQVSIPNKTITVTSPSVVTTGNFMGEATVLVGSNNALTGMYPLRLRAEGFYRVGEYYPDPFVDLNDPTQKALNQGVVFWVDPDDEDYDPETRFAASGKIIGLYQTYIPWRNTSSMLSGTSTTDGLANMRLVMTQAGWESEFPVFEWVHNTINGGIADYSHGTKGVWYLPAVNEWKAIFAGMSGRVFEEINLSAWGHNVAMPGYNDADAQNSRNAFKALLDAAKKDDTTFYLIDDFWTSTDYNSGFATRVNAGTGTPNATSKTNGAQSRAIMAF